MKKHTLAFLVLCSVLASVPTFAQTTVPPVPGVLVNADPTKPPPYLDVPGDPRPADHADPATTAIDPTLRTRVTAAIHDWSHAAGREFAPGFAYLHGIPTIMVMARGPEAAAVQARRLDAIVSACEFMLDDTAFSQAVICVATYNPKGTPVMTTRNTTITRAAFQQAARKAGNAPLLGDALAAAHKNPSAVKLLCTDLDVQ